MSLCPVTGARDAEPSDGGRRSARVIVNPNATTTSPRLRDLVLRALDHRYDVDCVGTEAPGHAIELAARAARDGVDAVVSLGGDGTVNEIANGIANTDVVLLALPGGATNVYHRLIGMPSDVIDATEHVLALADTWSPRRVDLGRLGHRWFTFAGGVGLDAAVVRHVDSHPSLKRRLGPWFFAAAAVGTFSRRYVASPPKLALALEDGRELTGATLILQNAEAYTYFSKVPIDMLEGSGLTTGDVRGGMLRRTTPTVMPGVTVRALSPRLGIDGMRAVDATGPIHAATLRTTDGRPVPIQVDGDHVGDVTEAEIAVGAGALRILA